MDGVHPAAGEPKDRYLCDDCLQRYAEPRA
jgi:hypothetical protein